MCVSFDNEFVCYNAFARVARCRLALSRVRAHNPVMIIHHANFVYMHKRISIFIFNKLVNRDQRFTYETSLAAAAVVVGAADLLYLERKDK